MISYFAGLEVGGVGRKVLTVQTAESSLCHAVPFDHVRVEELAFVGRLSPVRGMSLVVIVLGVGVGRAKISESAKELVKGQI